MTTFNTQGLLEGFVRVKENNGCAGVDGVTIARFERHLDDNIRRLESELAFQTYLPVPLRQILVDKGNGEARALSVSIASPAAFPLDCRINIEPKKGRNV